MNAARGLRFRPAIFLQRPILQMPAGIARVPRGCDAFVLAVGEPRVAGEVPQVSEVSPEAALATQDFVDGARAAIDAAAFINRVQFFEQVLELQVGKFRAHFFEMKIERLHFARVIELADAVETRAAHRARAVVQNRQHPRRRLADAGRLILRAHPSAPAPKLSALTTSDSRSSGAAARSPARCAIRSRRPARPTPPPSCSTTWPAWSTPGRRRQISSPRR